MYIYALRLSDLRRQVHVSDVADVAGAGPDRRAGLGRVLTGRRRQLCLRHHSNGERLG